MPIDYKKYPPNWKTELVPAVRKRSQGKCEKCGLENGQKVFSVKAWVKVLSKYKYKALWFSSKADAIREHGALCSSDPVKEVKVVLTVAHLDHDETNHNVSVDRLLDMCQICHLRYDAKEKMRRAFKK